MYSPVVSRRRRSIIASSVSLEPLEPRQLLTSVIVSVFEDINHDGIYQAATEPRMDRTGYIDLNNNGSLDPGEPTAQLDTTHRYTMDTGNESVVTVRATPELPDDWTASTPQSYTFATTTNSKFVSFGGYATGSTIPTGGLDAFVFSDANANGIQDAGENPDPNPNLSTRVILQPLDSSTYSNFGPELYTGQDGYAHFRNIRPGTYRVRVSSSNGIQSTPLFENGYLITIGEDIETASLGLAPSSSLGYFGGYVFLDNNENGIADAQEPLTSGLTVYIDANDNHVRDPGEHFYTTTNGEFWVYAVPNGSYKIRLDLPAGWHQTLPAADASNTVTVVDGKLPRAVSFGALDHEIIPTVTGSAFYSYHNPPDIELIFSKDIGSSLQDSDVVLHNLTTGQDFSTTTAYDASTKTGRIIIHPSQLSDGNYLATLAAGSVEDWRGNKVADAYSQPFFVLRGDLNRDRTVSINDFITLASRLGHIADRYNPNTYYTGDLNEDGSVSIADLIDLSSAFGKTLPPPNAAPAALAMAPASATITQTSSTTTKTKTRHHSRPKHGARELLS